MSTVSPPNPFRPGQILKLFAKYALKSKSAIPTVLKMVKNLESKPDKPETKYPSPKDYKYGDYPW